jgi:hypothetical protein
MSQSFDFTPMIEDDLPVASEISRINNLVGANSSPRLTRLMEYRSPHTIKTRAPTGPKLRLKLQRPQKSLTTATTSLELITPQLRVGQALPVLLT